jgi:hypothetical protein
MCTTSLTTNNSASCIYVFCVDLRRNGDYFPLQHSLIGFCNGDGVFTARYGLNGKL